MLPMMTLLLLLPSIVAAFREMGMHDDALIVSGRTEWRDDGLRFDLPGTLMAARPVSAAASVILNDTGRNRYAVSMNGSWLSTFASRPGKFRYVLYEGVAVNQPVDLIVMKLTEACGAAWACAWADWGVATLYGLELDDGAYLLPPRAPWMSGRRLEFVGDSITASWGALTASSAVGDAACDAGEDIRASWADVLASSLNAERHLVAWSGIGLVANDRADTRPTGATAPDIWDRAVANDPASQWNASVWVPDATVVHLGTNDFCCNHSVTAETFERRYVDFLNKVTALRSPYVFLGCGPMGPDYFPCDVVEQVARAANATGLVAHVLNFTGLLDDPGNRGGCGHPSVDGHAAMAAAAERILRLTLGWSP